MYLLKIDRMPLRGKYELFDEWKKISNGEIPAMLHIQ